PPDSDGDGFTDAAEIAAGTDPNDATSYPGLRGGACALGGPAEGSSHLPLAAMVALFGLVGLRRRRR
ncbi:MAG: thrombospondin type 3 repeat-containing protein, partial [Myxococcales bacterium]|nr:thrombospondin type 3 repeat-containing protein [Myxococcales bacterium]